ncbi:MAG: aldo/keto reductase [Planctomycetes bacterium]|nr:aldo/keto reductase [Planctomycetota bacterium]
MRERSETLPRRDFLKGVAAGAMTLSLAGPLANRLFAEEEAPVKKVPSRPLGSTGLSVSAVIWGGGGLQPGRSALLRAGFDRGLTTFDTAWGYAGGKSEEGLGEFVKDLGADREKIRIITKTSGYKPPEGTAKEVYAHFRAELDKSLRRLQTDYVDVLCWPHGAARPEHLKHEAMREVLLRLKEEKVVRHVGTSTHSNYVETTLAAMEDKGFYEVVMLVTNICTQNPEATPAPGRGRPILDTRPLLAAAKEKKFGIIPMKVMNPGFLAPNVDELLAKAYPGDSPLSKHQKLLRYILGQEGVSAAVVALNSAQHLKEAIEAAAL